MLAVTLLTSLTAIVLAIALLVHRRRHRAVLLAVSEALGDDRAEPTLGTLRSAVEDHHRRMRAVEHRADTITAAVAAADLGILVVDAGGSIVYGNPVAIRYLDARHGDALAGVTLEQMIAEVVANGTESTRSLEVYTPKRRHLALHALPLADAGSPGAAVLFVEDLTERARILAMRRDFVANASHELKTPLGALQILADAIAASDDPEVHTRLVGRLRDEAARMTNLIDDILDLATVEDNSPDPAPVPLRKVLEAAREKTRLLAETYRIDVELADVGDTVLSGDERQLVSVASNLIENAIKYTRVQDPDAPASVWIRGHTDGDYGVFEVEDHGLGIPERHLDRIFERFYRVDPGRSRDTGGTGLGLAIVRHVVQNHEGTVEVESQPGEGSVFRVKIPVWRE